MKISQPEAGDSPPEDGGRGNPPRPATGNHQPDRTEPVTAFMPRSTRKHRNAEVDLRGDRRSNATRASTTDPDVRLFRKSPGTGAMLCVIACADGEQE